MVPSGGRDQQSPPDGPPRQTPADLARSFFSDGADTETPATAAAAAGNPLGRLFTAVDSVSDSAMTYFYGHLFAIEPQARAMFPPAMNGQRKRFYQAATSTWPARTP